MMTFQKKKLKNICTQVLYYANRIFERAGLGFEAAVGVGLFKALMTLVSVQVSFDTVLGLF